MDSRSRRRQGSRLARHNRCRSRPSIDRFRWWVAFRSRRRSRIGLRLRHNSRHHTSARKMIRCSRPPRCAAAVGTIDRVLSSPCTAGSTAVSIVRLAVLAAPAVATAGAVFPGFADSIAAKLRRAVLDTRLAGLTHFTKPVVAAGSTEGIGCTIRVRAVDVPIAIVVQGIGTVLRTSAGAATASRIRITVRVVTVVLVQPERGSERSALV